MRVISLVPSLTETLVECGVEVVGRTRFCIHPDAGVMGIPVVGGTKQVNWDRCADLKPDLVLMDREENTLTMAESCPFPWIATHITSTDNLGSELSKVALLVENQQLEVLAGEWHKLAAMPDLVCQHWQDIPGLLAKVGEPVLADARVEYMIWRDPWMAVSRNTFIGSMLNKVGLGKRLHDHASCYPTLDDESLPDASTFYLFSSEPFPFEGYVDELTQLGFNGAIVDGEYYAWFGARSYRRLKQTMTAPAPPLDL